MKVRHVVALAAAVLGLAGGVVYVRSHPEVWIRVVDADRIREGDGIVARIEAYRMREKKLPDSLEEVGVPADSPFYYRRLGESGYVVWFSYTLGESYSYDSRTRVWAPQEVIGDGGAGDLAR